MATSKWKQTDPDKGAKSIWYIYRRNSKNKGIEFRLTPADFKLLVTKNCTYCGRPPSNHRHGFPYSGVDRLDPSKGYVPGNCVPCCFECNGIKSNKLTPEETRAVALALKAHREAMHGKGIVAEPTDPTAERSEEAPKTK